MSKFELSSKELLKGVLNPHTELALDLMGMVKSLSTGDSSSRFQIASIIIFLAGIDKTLNVAFGLLYLAGKVGWKWMVPNTRLKPPAGYIECQRGLTGKIMKLKELGVDLSHLQWMIDLRNEYIHSCHIYIGYNIGLDDVESKIVLKPSGPFISFPQSPISALRPDAIRYYADQLINEIGGFIDSVGWQSKWITLSKKIKHLPLNPEPEYTQLRKDLKQPMEIVDALNQRFVGDGAQLLRK